MLETGRLILRPFAEKDVEAVFALRQDAEIMRYIREPQKTLAETESWIKLVSSRWENEKIGFCAVIEKASDELIGWCGLWRLKETGEIEVGYAISKNFQGKSYATESAEACLAYGFEQLDLPKIVAVTHPENAASRRVMEKLGMRYDGLGKFYGAKLAHYSIGKRDWENSINQ